MQRLSSPTGTVLSNKITRNKIVPSFKDSPRKPLGWPPLKFFCSSASPSMGQDIWRYGMLLYLMNVGRRTEQRCDTRGLLSLPIPRYNEELLTQKPNWFSEAQPLVPLVQFHKANQLEISDPRTPEKYLQGFLPSAALIPLTSYFRWLAEYVWWTDRNLVNIFFEWLNKSH